MTPAVTVRKATERLGRCAAGPRMLREQRVYADGREIGRLQHYVPARGSKAPVLFWNPAPGAPLAPGRCFFSVTEFADSLNSATARS